MLRDDIRQIINSKGLKHCVVAERAGYTNKSFSDMLCGRKTIKGDDIPRLAKALDITPNELFGFSDKEIG